jgi:acetyl esterase
VLYAHGSGFVFVDLDSPDRVCRRLALTANAAVLSVDYRLAPEHPAPAAVDDLFNVARWSARLPDQVGPVMPNPALAGDSAGGAIAVLAAARLARASISSSAVLLICPNTDLTLSQPSVSSKASGWGLEAQALGWFVQQWAPDLSPDTLPRHSPRTRICAACQRLWLPPPSTIPCTTKASGWWIIYAPWHAPCPTPAWSMAS